MNMDERQLTPEARQAIAEYLRPRFTLIAASVSTAIAFIGFLLSSYISSSINSRLEETVRSEVATTQNEISRVTDFLRDVQKDALQSAAELKAKIKQTDDLRDQIENNLSDVNKMTVSVTDSLESLETKVNTLTTDEITSKLNAVEKRISTLSNQLDGLQKLIDPKTSAQILNVARMHEEILAREKFEKTITDKLASADTTRSDKLESLQTSLDSNGGRINDVEDDLRNLLFWILGIFVSLIAGVLGIFGFLGKRMADAFKIIAVQPKSEDEPETTESE